MTEKIYEGKAGGIVKVNGKPLNPRFDILNHSPTGFSWGYGGSGPSQLAFAILIDYFGDKSPIPLAYYQKFKWKIIANLLAGVDWKIKGEDIDLFFLMRPRGI